MMWHRINGGRATRCIVPGRLVGVIVGVLAVLLNARTASSAAGDLDLSFGSGGVVLTTVKNDLDELTQILVQPDGKIVAGGTVGSRSSKELVLVRYHADGSLDSTFGTGGILRTIVANPGRLVALQLQADGKLVGVSSVTGGTVIARYDADGSLDSTFGAAGLVVTNPATPQIASSAVLTPGGTLTVAGMRLSPDLHHEALLLRYGPDGNLDPTFGAAGVVVTPAAMFAENVVAQPDGRVVVSGVVVGGFFVARYNVDGSLDGTFGNGGWSTFLGTDLQDRNDMIQQSDGKLVLLGRTSVPALLRTHANGFLDSAFGDNGIALSSGTFFDIGNGLVAAADGKLVAVGTAVDGAFMEYPFIQRWNPNGSLDATFGTAGKVSLPVTGLMRRANAVCLDADARLLIAGGGLDGAGEDLAVVRLIGGTCGDGVTEGGEECDDGNVVPCDGCSVNCTLQPSNVCGDGVYRAECGEQCDDGNAIVGDGCSPSCQLDFIPGGGKGATDCFMEWGVVNPTNQPLLDRRGRFNSTQICRDNDPTCDIDAGIGQCIFHVTLCTNVTDSGLPCTPTALAIWAVTRPKQSQLPTAYQVLSEAGDALLKQGGSACSPYVSLPVSLVSQSTGTKKGKVIVRTTTTTTSGARDKDALKFICVP